MIGISPEDVTELTVKAASRRRLTTTVNNNRLHFRQLQSNVNAIHISYVIRTSNSSLSYSVLSTQLTEAVNTGVFSSTLTVNAQTVGATALVGCTSDTVDTTPITNSNNSNNSYGLSTDIIIGISIGAAVGLVALLCCCFVALFATMSSEKRREAATATVTSSPPRRNAPERKSPRKSSQKKNNTTTNEAADSPVKRKRKGSETGKKMKAAKQDKIIEEGDIELAVPYSLYQQRVDRGTDSNDPMLMYSNPMARTNFRSASTRRTAPPPSEERFGML